MKQNMFLGSFVVASSLLFVGCGGGGSSDPQTVTGQFVDTYVEGLNYTCSSGKEDVTNALGEYTCNVGDKVEFSLGGYVLGSATASAGIVTPETLYPDNEEAALNVAQVLQTLDSDDSDEIITIPDNFTDLDDVNTTPEDSGFDTIIEEELGETLVSEEVAQEHMDESLLKVLMAGKTFYTTIYDEMYTLESWAFNADATSATWTELIGGSDSGTGSIAIDGMAFTFTETYEGVVTDTIIVVKEILDDYVVVGIEGEPDLRLYFDREKAETYFLTLSPDLSTLITGTTKYFANTLGGTGYRIYGTDGSFTGSVTLADGTTLATSGTYDIVDNVLTINRTAPSDTTLVLTYLGQEDGGLGFDITVNGGEVFETISFPTEAERDAYVASLNNLDDLIRGTTKYFANTQGATGYRTYATDGSFTGSVTLADGTILATSGTYNIVDNVLTISRTSSSDVTLVLTYLGEEDGGLGFNITVNGGEVFQTISFSTEAERDAYVEGSNDVQSLLANKTLYFVGQSENDPTDIWSGEITFNSDLSMATVVEGGATEILAISIDANKLVFTEDTDGSYSIIGDDKGDYIELIDSFSDGSVESYTRLYYDQSRAEAYVSTLSENISVPTRTITLDGSTQDWDGISPVLTDTTGEVTYSGLDISAMYVAQDDSYIYVRIDRASSTDVPTNGEDYNYWVYFKDTTGVTDFGIEAYHWEEGPSVRLHQGDYNIVIEGLSSHVSGTSMEFAVPKGYVNHTLYTVDVFTHHTVNDSWVDDNGDYLSDGQVLGL